MFFQFLSLGLEQIIFTRITGPGSYKFYVYCCPSTVRFLWKNLSSSNALRLDYTLNFTLLKFTLNINALMLAVLVDEALEWDLRVFTENCYYGFPALILNETMKCTKGEQRRNRHSEISDQFIQVKEKYEQNSLHF